MVREAGRKRHALRKVQFGSGPKAYPGWTNFDCSPSLLLQKLPLLGLITRRYRTTTFDDAVRFGDARNGLPLSDESVDLLYCSHTLEHLALDDLRRSLKESFRILAPGGVFRAVMPDLEIIVADYMEDTKADACSQMMMRTYMATKSRPRGFAAILRNVWGNSRHMWLWDYKGIRSELMAAGFTDIRRAYFGDCSYPEFANIEVADRWERQLGFECRKPSGCRSS